MRESDGLRRWQALLRGEAHLVRDSPAFLCQQLANQADLPEAAEAARARLARESRAWLRWLNRPERIAGGPVTLAAMAGTVTIHVVSPDGRRVLAGARRTRRVAGPPLEIATLRRWEIESGRELTTYYENQPWRVCVIAPDGERFVAISTEPLTESWDEHPLSRSDRYFRSCVLHDAAGSVVLRFSGRQPILFSADGRRLLAQTEESELTLWDADRGEELARFAGHAPCALSSDGSRVFWMSVEGRLISRDLASGAETTPDRAELAGFHGGAAIAPQPGEREARSADGHLFATVEGARIRVHEAGTGRTVAELAGHSAQVSSVAFLADGSGLLSGSRDGTLRFWPLDSGILEAAPEGSRAAHGAVAAMVFSRDGEEIVCATDRDEVVHLDARTARPLGGAAKLASGALRGLAADAETVAVALVPGSGWLAVRPLGGDEVPIGRARGRVRLCSFSPDRSRLLSVADSGEVALWWTEPGREPIRFRPGDGLARPPRCAAFSPDGATIATAGLSGEVQLWSVSAGRILRRLPGRGGLDAEACDFGADGTWVATAHRRGISVWSAADGEPLFDWRENEGTTALRFAPSGDFLATGSASGRVRIVRCSGWSLACEAPSAGSVTAVAWSPDGQRLAVAAAGGVQVFALMGLRR